MIDKPKTPNCNMHEALVSYLYNEATHDEKILVEAHLRECAVCKEELGAFERVRGMLQQWQLDDLPVVRVVAGRPATERSMMAALKEFLGVAPVWAKAIGVVAMAMFVLSILGTDVRVGGGGVSFHTDLFRRTADVQRANAPSVSQTNEINIEQVRTEVKGLVNQLVAESERHQQDEIKAQLVSLESQLQNMRSADLTKLATRIQEHQSRLKTIEQDIDRREGLDLTDILFSEVSRPRERSATGGSD